MTRGEDADSPKFIDRVTTTSNETIVQEPPSILPLIDIKSMAIASVGISQADQFHLC